MTRWSFPLLLLGLVCTVGCDSSSPVAPSGTVLTISANPSRIAVDGTSEIVVVGTRPNGTAIKKGTVIHLNTTIGVIDESVEADDGGVARATLRGNGQAGTATVTASTGSAESVSIDVQIGPTTSSITLQATPSSVGETGGEIQLVSLVRDDQGQPQAGALVNFKTDVGTLESGGSFLETDANGEVRDRLTISEGDLDPISGDTFQVQAEVGGSGGALLTAAATITIQRLPRADFSFGTSGLTVVFTDTSTGNPTQWFWDFGDGNSSTLQNPTHTYANVGTFTVTLTATNSQGSDTISKFVAVTGQ